MCGYLSNSVQCCSIGVPFFYLGVGGASSCRIDTIYGTWSFVRATRYSMPPKAAATYCHILDVVGPRTMDILDIVGLKGATIGRIDILINL